MFHDIKWVCNISKGYGGSLRGGGGSPTWRRWFPTKEEAVGALVAVSLTSSANIITLYERELLNEKRN